jgi:streptogramin lyase
MVTPKINIYKMLLFLSFVVVFSSCEQEVFTENENSNGTDNCSVFISSNPEGAKIYVDNKFSGYVTPDTIKWLAKNSHTLTLKFNLIQDTSIVLQTAPSAVQSVFIDYFASPRNYGAINCESVPPGAAIYVNNNKQSQITPYTIPYLFPGVYNVKLRYAGYRDDSLNVTVRGGSFSSMRLNLQDTSTWIDYRVNNSNIPSNKIVAMKKDSKNNIWAGTLDCGIVKFTKGRFTIYNTSNSGLPYDFTTCLEVDKNDNIWVGTISGLARFNGTNWTVYRTNTSKLPANYITAIYCDPVGNVWIGTEKGLARITGNEMFAYSSQTSSLLQNYISGIASDSKGNLWFGAVGGITRLADGSWKTYSREHDGLLGYDAGCLAGDADGNIWCAFPENLNAGIIGGLMKFNGTGWSEVSVPAIPKGRIQSIYVDSKGYKWIGSAKGFLVIKNDNTQTLYMSTSYAMWSYDVRGFTIDNDNNAWIALYGGGILKWKKPYN